MTDNIQRLANLEFSKRVRESRNLTTVAGRYQKDSRKVKYVWHDIMNKLRPKVGNSFLDIGCGYSRVTRDCIQMARQMNLTLYLQDIPDVIEAVRKDFFSYSSEFETVSATFPSVIPEPMFDRILLYSVVQYSSNPMATIGSAVERLALNGRLLIGDIPNVSRKSRYMGAVHLGPIDDAFVIAVLATFRTLGYDVYIVPQPETLPFCYSREDILIERIR